MTDLIQTSNNMKQMFRDKMRNYFRAQTSMKLQHLKDVVLMLMNHKEIKEQKILEDEMGAEGIAKLKDALKQCDKLYSYANMIQDTIIKLEEKHDSERMKMKIDHENKRLMEIAASLPPTNFRIMKAFQILVNATDLRNLSIPKDERFDARKPSYLPSGEGGSF